MGLREELDSEQEVRDAGRVVSMACLVAIGAASSGERRVLRLDLAAGNDEGNAWPSSVRGLLERGLRLVITTPAGVSSRPSTPSSWARGWQRRRLGPPATCPISCPEARNTWRRTASPVSFPPWPDLLLEAESTCSSSSSFPRPTATRQGAQMGQTSAGCARWWHTSRRRSPTPGTTLQLVGPAQQQARDRHTRTE